MGRAPCCEKMGLKKGPWNPEEDQILISFILQHGHSNWRALPKQAGLLRCGKSCRLRWMNYLRPDIIRGNFTKDEEDTIITLHEMLGNRWSAIAARLPGRTDNEIKNVWHTHLKKRVKDYYKPKSKPKPKPESKKHSNKKRIESEPENSSNPIVFQSTSTYDSSFSPSSSTSDLTSATLISREVENKNKIEIKFEENNNYSFDTEINESFWSEALYNDGKSSVMEPTSSHLQVKGFYGLSQEFQFGSVSDQMFIDESNNDVSMDFFWYDLFSEQKTI